MSLFIDRWCNAIIMRMSEFAVVNYEIVDSLIEEKFTSAEDEDIIQELREKLESLGLDPEKASELVLDKTNTKTTSPAAQPYQVLPQREWQMRKKGLNDEVKRAANMLVNRLNLKGAGREIVNSGVPANNNFVACVTLINKEIKKRNPKERKDWSTEEFEEAPGGLEGILNNLTRLYKGILDA